MTVRQRGGRGFPAAPLAFLLALTLLAGCDLPGGADGTQDPSRDASSTGADGTRTAPARERYHRELGQPYRFENSPRGLRYAHRHGYAWIDIDSIHTRADAGGRPVPLATHWPRIDKEGFDPDGRYPPETRWTDLSLDQVRVLRTADEPPYRILTMVEMVREAARVGLTGIEWEIKDGDAFARAATYRPVLRAAARWGIEIEVKTIHRRSDPERSLARLRAAKEAGATTMLLNLTDRPIELTTAQQQYVDLVRGSGGWEPA